MKKLSQSLSSSFLLISLITLTILITPTTCNTKNYLLNCGAQTTTINNQTWHTDEDPTFAPPAAYKAATTGAPATNQDPDAMDQVPCTTARTFHAPFTYSFPVSHGPKFVRLHFCAYGTYDNIYGEHFFLSVQANGGVGPFTLLHNYSAYLHQQHFEHTYSGPIAKEFLVMATTSRLNLTFSPTTDGYLGFVNGIEIVDVPDGLYDYLIPQSVEDSGMSTGRSATAYRSTICLRPTHVVNNPTVAFSLIGPTALETVTRLNVGGAGISPENDSGGVSRTWYKDDDSLLQSFVGASPNRKKMKIHYTASVPVYTAPDALYWTARVMGPYNDTFKMKHNLTWEFTVESGFDYLVRLHLCEIDKQVTKSGQREFDVLINEQKAQTGVDVMYLTKNRRGTPVCKDYVASIYDGGGGETNSTKVPLRLTLRPDIETHPLYHDVLLNGLEIFKMNQSNGNLAGPNPTPLPDNLNRSNTSGSSPSKGSAPLLIIEIVAGVLGSLVLITLILALAFRWWMSVPSSIESKQLLPSNNTGSSTTISSASSLPSHLCHCFSLQQIKVATSDFNDDFVIGVGGFGKVYKASIAMDDGTEVMVAIKRLNPSSKQGAHEFRTELEMLTVLRHVHLVSLIGYCHENGEMVLVYEYMPLGTLQDHLYQTLNTRNNDMINNTNYAPMPWKQRLMTCIGAARGLNYLHTGATSRVIIHRDVKSSNILLDKNWVAKVSDFGISKIGPSTEEGAPTYISTLVKGSIGYLDPEYLRLKQLTYKSDVYSFGVVLFEVLCARPVMVPSLENEQVNLARYAKRCYKEDTLHEIVDPNVRGEIAPECLSKFGEIADKCVRDNGSERPSMEEVVWYLEFALQLQETSDENNKATTTPSLVQVIDNDEGNAEIGSEFITSTELFSSQTSTGTVLLPH